MDNLLSLQQLFGNKVFNVPNYQRGYSWENIHRKDLLDDLESINGKRHYTGTIVLKENGKIEGGGKTYSKFDIVDGQQRITSLVILINVIAKELKELDYGEADEIAENLLNDYIRYESKTGNKIYKLELDQDNKDFFEQKILDFEFAEPSIKSHYRLQEAEKQFLGYLLAKKNRDNYFIFLKDIVRKITQLLVFTVYYVEDDAEVGVIFEVMNDRGKPLSQLEKVKNLLIYYSDRISLDSMAKDNMICDINYSWKEILENLSKANRSKNEDENQFLRLNYINKFYSELKPQKDEYGVMLSINSQLSDIHGLLKDKLKRQNDNQICYKEMKDYIHSLKDMSFRFRDLVNPADPMAFYGIDESIADKIKLVARQLNRLDIQTNILALLLAIYEKYLNVPNQLLKLMTLCEIFIFRVYYIGNWRSYSAQSTLYSLANRIYNSETNYDELVNNINQIMDNYCPIDQIKIQLSDSNKNWYDWNGLKYMLYEYERKRCLEEGIKNPVFEWEELKEMKKEDSIEHILPQTIINERGKEVAFWTERFKGDESKRNLNRLGNLVLSSENSKLGNKAFYNKIKIYCKSKWQIERDIAKDYTDWTEKEINDREQKLIDFAVDRWGINTT